MAERDPEHAHDFIPEDSFGVRLLIIRSCLGLTQNEAADLCGLDDGSWSNWERGRSPRSMPDVVEAISRNLCVDRDWLMWGGPLRRPRSALTSVPSLHGQCSLFDQDLRPLEFYDRGRLARC